MMTRALDCFGYCIQVDYLPMLELRLEKVTNSVLMICKFYLQIFSGRGSRGRAVTSTAGVPRARADAI